jgi:hypothetical protein
MAPRRTRQKTPGPHTEETTLPLAPKFKAPFDDDRPTELYERREPIQDLAHSRQQLITGSTIREMMKNKGHLLSEPLAKLFRRAKRDLPQAEIDQRASLMLRHDFEFDRRVGYSLQLKVFDAKGACVEVVAEVDQDGRAIRRGSMVSKLIEI